MVKKLKIRFTKFENALVMQILEQTGEFAKTKHVRIVNSPEFSHDKIYLRGADNTCDFKIDCMSFSSNAERDEYLTKIIGWITDEQFTSSGELKVGEMCEVKMNQQQNWISRKLLAILPSGYCNRYITHVPHNNSDWDCWKYARLIEQRIEPKIDNDIYTWEM